MIRALFLAIALAVPLVGCGGEERAQAPPAARAPDPLAVYEGVPQDGVRLGSAAAPATLVEFADMQCPFCGRYARDVMATVVRDYVRPGRIAYELRMRAFIGRDSVRAAGAAAAAARQDRLYEFTDLFYREQGPENSGYVTNAFVRGIAERVPGLDVARVVAAANDPLAQPLVHRAQAMAERVGSTGTPDFYLRRRGEREFVPVTVRGFAPEEFTRALEAALAAR